MIEGLKIELTSAQVKDHFEARAVFHSDKAVFYAKQAQTLADGGVQQLHVTNDPTTSLKQSSKTHTDRAGFFRFMAEHVIPDETYRLSESDFTRLEFAAAMW